MPPAPPTPDDRSDPADDGGVPPLIVGGPDPVTPWGDRRPFVRFAAGLSRQHAWPVITARLVAVAILLGVVLYVLAEFARSV